MKKPSSIEILNKTDLNDFKYKKNVNKDFKSTYFISVPVFCVLF